MHRLAGGDRGDDERDDIPGTVEELGGVEAGRVAAPVGDDDPLLARDDAREDPPGLLDVAARGEVGPVETLRGALHAARASGEPDWPTRVAAAKALAALRPEEVEADKDQPEAQIIVYDLPSGAVSILHRAREGEAEAPANPGEAPPEQLPPSDRQPCVFMWVRLGMAERIGEWSPANRDESADAVVSVAFADSLETAERWRAELAAGRLP